MSSRQNDVRVLEVWISHLKYMLCSNIPQKEVEKKIFFIFGHVCLWWLTFLKLDYELWHVIRHLDTFSHVSFLEVMTCRTTTSPDQLFLRALRKGTVCHFLGHNFPGNPTEFSEVSFWRPSRSVFPWKQYKSC